MPMLLLVNCCTFSRHHNHSFILTLSLLFQFYYRCHILTAFTFLFPREPNKEIMKKQDALIVASSSSTRRENSPDTIHAKTIGCMSGFFNLVFNYNNRRRRHRKFLTYGQKQEKKREAGVANVGEETENQGMRRLSCEVERSPMLGADIRLSKSTVKSASESAAEKRKKLVEALGKCEEDLKALKRMIEVVKMNDSINNNINNAAEVQQQPSPVSVLHYSLTLTPPSPFAAYTHGGPIQQQKQKPKKKPGEDEISNICLVDRIKTEVEQVQAKPFWISKAMIESVNEVCRDITWGERREIGRIGLALQDFICRDLIEEFVRELGCYSCSMYSLPFEACKRQLLF